MEVDNAANIYKDGLTAEILIPLKKLMVIHHPFLFNLNEKGEIGVRHIDNDIAKFSK